MLRAHAHQRAVLRECRGLDAAGRLRTNAPSCEKAADLLLKKKGAVARQRAVLREGRGPAAEKQKGTNNSNN